MIRIVVIGGLLLILQNKEIQMHKMFSLSAMLIICGFFNLACEQKKQIATISNATTTNATISLEAVSLNGQPISPPQSKITASPGDVISTRIFLRDFSPNGEKLRAYQATIDWRGFESGESGSIRPKDFKTTTMQADENRDNGFIDIRETDYIHRNLNTVSVVDTVSFGYRYLGVLINRTDSVKCKVPGKRYILGTLNLEVDKDATGVFTIPLDRSPSSTALRDDNNAQITPLNFEDLTIQIDPNRGTP